ncbi:MAG: TOBE domain-containing protein, partial [Oscillospiraceae bacterium]|nr:TOBE domain-containing protein [Oscillospiraceae bacterium]
KPKNLFVAGFIGTPQMNFADVTVSEETEGSLIMPDGSFVHYGGDADLSGYAGKTVTMGVRPDEVRVCSEGLSAKVDVVERLGGETYLYTDCGGIKLTAKIPGGTRLKPDDDVFLAFAPDKIHIFDTETTLRISRTEE